MQFPRAPVHDDDDGDDEVLRAPPRTPTRRQSPSLPSSLYSSGLHFQYQQDIDAFTAQRPHLGSLDLASPILRPISRHAVPRRLHKHSIDSGPLTPPLTPESASTSSSIVSHLDLFRFPRALREITHESDEDDPDDDAVVPSPTRIDLWTTASNATAFATDDKSSLAASFDALLKAAAADTGMRTGRFLLVSGVPPNMPSHVVKLAFENCEEVRGIYVRFQASHGTIILAFFDTRHCANALQRIRSQHFFDGRTLNASYISSHHLRENVPPLDLEFVSKGEASLQIFAQGNIDHNLLQKVLSGFGDLCNFTCVNELGQFLVEFYDCRTSMVAFSQLHNRTVVAESRIRVSFVDPQAQASALSGLPSPLVTRPPSAEPSSARRGGNGAVRSQQSMQLRLGLHHTASDNNLKDRFRPTFHSPAVDFHPSAHNAGDVRKQASMSNLNAGHRLASRTAVHNAPTSPSSSMVATESTTGSSHDTNASSPVSSVHTPLFDPVVLHMSQSHNSDKQRDDNFSVQIPPRMLQHSFPVDLGSQRSLRYEAPPFIPNSFPSRLYAPMQCSMPVIESYPAERPRLPHIDTSTIESYYPGHSPLHSSRPTALSPSSASTFTMTPIEYSAAHKKGNERDNAIDLEKVERGGDTRTTVMIKNIPNKMSDKNLLDFINEVCPRRIDFMYLRMDFINNCNVGYAFVNFITVQDLITFCKARLGVKWNMFQSEKVLNATYANYQGKEALVEKFKNSCIMDERDSWRPKIFFSSGAEQGLPEPFPPPSHLKRKERSQANARERVLFAHQNRHVRARGDARALAGQA